MLSSCSSSLRGTVGLWLLFLAIGGECAPQVVTGLTIGPDASFATPPPSPVWAAVVDPATLSKMADLPVGMAAGGIVAADLHGHRAYLSGYISTGSAIEIIDTSLNLIEAVIGTEPRFPSTLATDPVRARLYIASTYPQPEIAVLDTRALSFLPPIALPPGLRTDQGVVGPIVTLDGTRLFVAFSNTVVAVDLPDGVAVQVMTQNIALSALAVNLNRNELYVADGGTGSVLVLAADSLAIKRKLTGFDSISALAVRPSDGALLVETNPGFDYTKTLVYAVDAVTGQVLTTGSEIGYRIIVGINGKEVYRIQRGDHTMGAPYADTNESLVVLDAAGLNQIGMVALDSRTPSDPSRQNIAIRATDIAATPKVALAVEYYDATLGHYFITSIPAEIVALDAGRFPGWQRTGETLPVYAQAADGPGETVPVCRFYGLPEKGLNSHFYSASVAECAEVQQRFGDSWLLESPDVFDVYLADAATGTCPFETTPVYRVYNNRPDANHRYTTSLAIRDSMLQAGWIAEGYGPNAVAFCGPR